VPRIAIRACKLPRQPAAGEPPEAGPATPLAVLSFEIGYQYHPALEVHRTTSGRLFAPGLGVVFNAVLAAAVEQAIAQAMNAPDADFRPETDSELADRREAWARHRGYETIARLRAGRVGGAG